MKYAGYLARQEKQVVEFEKAERRLLPPDIDYNAISGLRLEARPKLSEIRDYCASQLDTLWDEVKRFENPHRYYVDLSEACWNSKHMLLSQKQF